MDNNILVIGNGFDLHHNLKTKYFDFVEFTRNSIDMTDIPDEIKNKCKNNIFLKYFRKVCEVTRNWIDCEKEIENVASTLQDLINAWKIVKMVMPIYLSYGIPHIQDWFKPVFLQNLYPNQHSQEAVKLTENIIVIMFFVKIYLWMIYERNCKMLLQY